MYLCVLLVGGGKWGRGEFIEDATESGKFKKGTKVCVYASTDHEVAVNESGQIGWKAGEATTYIGEIKV